MSTPMKPSKSNPQYVAMLRRIMLVDALIKARNEDYEKEMSAFLKKSPSLTEQERESFTAAFTRKFYSEETAALATFEAVKKRENQRIEPTFSAGNDEQKEKDRYILAMEAEAYVAQSLFTESAFKSLSEKYPDVANKLKIDIREESKKFTNQVAPSAAHLPATVSLFNARYPNMEKQLEQLRDAPANKDGKAPEKRKMASAALSMLKVSSAVMNPSGFFLSKAIGGILQTKAMQPLVSEVGTAVQRVAQKSGLTSAVKSQFSKLSTKQRIAVAGALSAVGVTAMVMAGIIEPDKAIAYAADLSQSAVDWGNDMKEAIAYNTPNITLPDFLSSEDFTASKGHLEDKMLETPLPEDISAESPVSTVEKTTPSALDNVAPDHVPENGLTAQAKPENIASALASAEPATTATPEQIANALSSPAGAEAGLEVSPGSPATVPSENIKIKWGDTLSQIVEARLQQAGVPYDYTTIQFHVNAVAELNELPNPDQIRAGATLTFPEIPAAQPLVNQTELAAAMQSSFDIPPLETRDWSNVLAQGVILKNDPLYDALAASHLAPTAEPEPIFKPNVTPSHISSFSPKP